MSGLARTYVTEVHHEYRYWPAWMPLTRISIGDCGPLEDDIFFKRRRSVTAFGVSPSALRDEQSERDPALRFTSQKAVDISAQAAGESANIPGIPPAEVGAQITFTRANATVLAALGVSERRLADQYSLEQELRRLVEQGIFPPEYVVVTDVVAAESARVLISTSAGQSVTLRAGVSAPVGAFDLASLGGQLSVAMQSTVGHEYDGTKGATPIFRLMGFNVGSRIRRFKRWIFRQGASVPRIVVGSIDATPVVGGTMTVQPIGAEPLAIAALGREPFVVEPRSWQPFAVEPILVDTGAVDALFERPGIGAAAEGVLGSHQGIALGSLEAETPGSGSLVVRLFEDSPILIQPVDDDPFLVKPVRGAPLSLEPADLGPLGVPEVVSRWAVEDDEPLRFDYVDFDAELAADEGVSA